MVSIFNVYDKQENKTVYVLMNDEGFSLQTVDTICNDELFETDEELHAAILGEWSLDDLTSEPSYDQHQFTEEEFALYKHCQFEFYKEDCKYFKRWIHLPIDQLPGEMYNELGMDAIEWHHEHQQLVSTNGYEVKPSEYYKPGVTVEVDKNLQQVIDFDDWHKQQAAIEELYEEHYVLSFAGHSVKLPYDADVFSAIDDLLKNVIKEW